MIFFKGDPVHSRHFYIKGDDIGHFLPDPVGGNERIGRRGHHLELRI